MARGICWIGQWTSCPNLTARVSLDCKKLFAVVQSHSVRLLPGPAAVHGWRAGVAQSGRQAVPREPMNRAVRRLEPFSDPASVAQLDGGHPGAHRRRQSLPRYREMRRPGGTACLHGSSDSALRNGLEEFQAHRRRREGKGYRPCYDDLAGTILGGRRRPLRTRIACLHLRGRNFSGWQIGPGSRRAPSRGGGSVEPSRNLSCWRDWAEPGGFHRLATGAEGVGFEPTDLLRGQRFSRPLSDVLNANGDSKLGISSPALAHHLPPRIDEMPADLRTVADAWRGLPAAVRAGIVAMVKASQNPSHA